MTTHCNVIKLSVAHFGFIHSLKVGLILLHLAFTSFLFYTLHSILSSVVLSQVLTLVVMKSSTFWDTAPLKVNRRFGGTCRLHLQYREVLTARNQRQTCIRQCFLFLLHASVWLLAWFILQSWRLMRYFLRKRRLTFKVFCLFWFFQSLIILCRGTALSVCTSVLMWSARNESPEDVNWSAPPCQRASAVALLSDIWWQMWAGQATQG
jgi:hypothetical protein